MAFPPIIKFISVFILIVFLLLEQNHHRHHHHRWGQGLNVLEGNNGPFCSVSPPFLFRQVIPPFSSSTRHPESELIVSEESKSEHFHLLVVFWLKYCFLTVVCIIDGGHDRGVGSSEGGRMGVFTVQYHIITLSYYHITPSVKISTKFWSQLSKNLKLIVKFSCNNQSSTHMGHTCKRT